MYKIENKKVAMKSGEEVFYKTFLETCNMVAPKDGWTPNEQRKSLRVDATLEKYKDSEFILMESSDFDYIKPKVEQCPWTIKDIAIVDFSDYIKELKEEK